MELKHLLDSQHWSEGHGFPERAIEKDVKSGLISLGKQYYFAVGLNFMLLLTCIVFLLLKPSVEMTVTFCILIVGFGYVFLKAMAQLRGYLKVDKDQDLKTVLRQTLDSDLRINREVTSMCTVIYTNSFMGGFLLGLFTRGWTFSKMIEKPIILPIMLILTVLFYFLTKSSAFNKFHSRLNSGYHRNRKFLKEQLQYLESH